MFYPPSQSINLDIEALSGICGSISIACWVVVFSPQIIENFRRSSAEGLSVVFIVVWLLGDIFNILGAVLQGVLPTMVILAVYYTVADVVLLAQCFYYKGFTLRDEVPKVVGGGVENGTNGASRTNGTNSERTPLLGSNGSHSPLPTNGNGNASISIDQHERRYSGTSLRERLMSLDGTHFSPATPLHADPKPREPARAPVAQTAFQGIIFNVFVILLVCLSGVLGWYLSSGSSRSRQDGDETPEREIIAFNSLGQVFGYICAVLYLGSRIPQLLLNYRRKSTEGISMLFFLFACIGNATYVMSIFAYSPQAACARPGRCEPGEAAHMYARYIAVNLSWIIGSLGTLFLDAAVFVQFFMYRAEEGSETASVEEAVVDAPEAEVRRERRRRRSVAFEE